MRSRVDFVAKLFVACATIFAPLLLSSQPASAQFTQQGPKLVGTGAVQNPLVQQGSSVAVSADGTTAIVGGPLDNDNVGAVWVYTRSNGAWTQQGGKLVGTGGGGQQGTSVALSADGNTAIIGGTGGTSAGAAWIFTRSGDVWTQQGGQLVGSGGTGIPEQGVTVALSADGNTAIVGGRNDQTVTGAAWVFTRSSGVWSQKGNKLVGTGIASNTIPPTALQGASVALSADGKTAMVGGPGDNSGIGAVWVYTLQKNGKWTQQGSKLVGTGTVGNAGQGWSVALSTDGSTAMVGGPYDNAVVGAVWAYTRSGGVWTQQGSKLVGAGAVTGYQGRSVALSGDGNTAIAGAPLGNGAVWAYTRSGGVWTQQGGMLASSDAQYSEEGFSVALSADGITAIMGAPYDNMHDLGAAWVFVQPKLEVTPATSIAASGTPGGPFSPSSFTYTLSATIGSFNYSISGVPSWLTASSTSGTASTGTTVTFTVNAAANSLAAGTYGPATINFTNVDTGQGTQTRTATLTVNPPGPALQVTPATNIAASGTHGGPFSPSSYKYTLSATTGSLSYTIATPSWLTASSKSGTVTTSPKTVTITVNSSANSSAPNTYVGSININNTTNGQGNSGRVATLTVIPKDYKLSVNASPAADGSVEGGGEVPEGSSTTVTATANSGFHFVRWTENSQQVSTSSSYTFTMPSKVITLVADFQKN
jgi:Divergent InlB B-repeat domain